MIALSNVKTDGWREQTDCQLSPWHRILTDLIGAAEDIARYDMILIMADRANQDIDPNWTAPEPIPEEVPRTRIRWIWSRTPEQIRISNDVERYIIEQATC